MDNAAIMAIITGIFATAMMFYVYMTNRKFLKKQKDAR
nr:MAG TPA: Erythropoietin receptor PROTEIN [Caudoviricetes sp.]